MVHNASSTGLLTSLPIVEEVLADHASELGRDFVPYRNHVYRIVNLCLAMATHRHLDVEKIAVAAVFHDLGIWTNKTFDYIAPSVELARTHLAARGLADWIPEIEAMIVDHHKVTKSQAASQPLVESFRRADWTDVTLGRRRFGLPRTAIGTVTAQWPSAGFHRRLVELTMNAGGSTRSTLCRWSSGNAQPIHAGGQHQERRWYASGTSAGGGRRGPIGPPCVGSAILLVRDPHRHHG